MPNYDFLNLSPFDFEELTRDLLQKYYDIYFESFTTGRDKGIDLRCSKASNNDLIVQCKKYNNYSSLKSSLKEEYQKVKILNPKKYVLSTSVGLTPLNKDEIVHHINGKILDKRIDNLEMHSRNSHFLEHLPTKYRKNFKKFVVFHKCSGCGTVFKPIRNPRFTRVFCSRNCWKNHGAVASASV